MSTSLFIASLFGILLMLSWKAFEIKVRKIDFISNFFAKADTFFKNFFEKAYFLYKRYQLISKLFFFEFLPSYLYEILVKMKDYVAKKYYHLALDEFRGRRVLRSNGSVSFFLEQITSEEGVPSERKV